MTQQNKSLTKQQAAELIDRAQILIPEEGVFEKLRISAREGRPLRIKMGFDPTSPDLHLGHAVAMHQLKKFQELGHILVIIIGDFTGRIGDPSGRNQSRPLVDPAELERNAKTYLEQLGRILDTSKIEIRRNSEWLEGMTLSDVIGLLAQGSLAQVISREDFRTRLDNGSPIALHEIVYPMLQGMDSVMVEADIEVGGVDQLYAFQAGRQLQGNKGVNPQALVMTPLLVGLDGVKKMSKSLGNYIGLADPARDMFGKLMSIPDPLIPEYLNLASTFSADEVNRFLTEIEDGQNPMNIKLELARNVTSIYHPVADTKDAEEFFNNQFRSKGVRIEYAPLVIKEAVEDLPTLIVYTGVVNSKSKARALIRQGAVILDGVKQSLDNLELKKVDKPFKLRVGKRHYFLITLHN